jgi:hypothetical protein
VGQNQDAALAEGLRRLDDLTPLQAARNHPVS